MTFDGALGRTILVFFASEAALSIFKRSRHAAGATRADRGTRLVLVVTITAAITLAVMFSRVPATRLPWPAPVVEGVALALLLSGLAIRWWAVVTLGRFFTVDVAIHDDHALVDRGPYRIVRHPSYTGLLLAFAGLGVAFGNAASVALLLLPIGAALAQRIRVEEAALRDGLGDAYRRYEATTKRLIPGLY